MKASKYILALVSAALICSCSDKDNFIEVETPSNEAEVPEISLVASIGDEKTRVAYTDEVTGMKVAWEPTKTVVVDGVEQTQQGDFLMVFPNKSDRSEIKLSSHDLTDDEKAALTDIFVYDNEKETYKIIAGQKYTSDKAYEFKIIPGENGERCTFKYTGNMIWYEESEITEDYQVSSATNTETHTVKIRVKHHALKTGTPDAALTIDENFSGLALWEHTDNESGDCQIGNGSTAHLKYQEVLMASVTSANFSTDTNPEAQNIVMTHPKTVIFKIIMNQFLYNLHRGSHVGIRGLTASNEHGFETYDQGTFIGGVYHQARSEFFEYNQTVEPAKILTVTPVENGLGYGETVKDGKIFAGDLEHTLTTYIMVDASKLAGYQAFQFSLTDNWSHDLYIWRLKLSAPLTGSENGTFYTVDLTNRVCNQFVWMGDDDYVWAIRNHMASHIQEVGGYYRYGELTPVMTNPTTDEFNTKCEEMTPDNYTSQVHSDWLSTLRALTYGNDENSSLEQVSTVWQFKSNSLPSFLETGEKIHIVQDYIDTRLKDQYDAIFKDTKGLMKIPCVGDLIKSSGMTTTNGTFNNVTGAFFANSKGHKIFIPKYTIALPSKWGQASGETQIENPNFKSLDNMIATSSYQMSSLIGGTAKETFTTVLCTNSSHSTYKKAIYHAVTLRGVAKMLHKGERAATGEVTVTDGETNGETGN